jgi:hypothetical protein
MPVNITALWNMTSCSQADVWLLQRNLLPPIYSLKMTAEISPETVSQPRRQLSSYYGKISCIGQTELTIKKSFVKVLLPYLQLRGTKWHNNKYNEDSSIVS